LGARQNSPKFLQKPNEILGFPSHRISFNSKLFYTICRVNEGDSNGKAHGAQNYEPDRTGLYPHDDGRR